jgi:hypothetical protein
MMEISTYTGVKNVAMTVTFGAAMFNIGSPARSTMALTQVHIGLQGPQGEGLTDFTTDAVAYYILAKN